MVVREQQYNHVDYTSYFGDQRLEERGNSIAAEILNKETAVLNQICDTRAELVGTCRFFNNDHVPQLSLVGDAGIRCAELTQGIHVLAIGDTSEINYQHHAGKRNYKKLPIEEKESYRWIASGQKTQELLDQASSITMIYDREADIYEEFVELPDEKTDVIVRSTQNRCLYDQDDKLFEHLCGQSCAGSYTLEIPKGHKKREARTADIEVRVSPVKLCRPMNTANKDLPEYVELYAIEAKEKDSSVPAGEKPILWRLLTTHKITNFADAMQIINWYRWRWGSLASYRGSDLRKIVRSKSPLY